VDTYFVSFDGKNRNIAAFVVDTLRRHNPKTNFFWTGDSLVGGKGWFAGIEQALADTKGVICVITNNESGTNNWINLEVGAAIGGRKHCMIIIAPAELSRPLQELQYVGWSDSDGLLRELRRANLAASSEALDDLVAALEPPRIRSGTYGLDPDWHTFSAAQRGRFMVVLENRKEVVIGNHLIDDDDLSPWKSEIPKDRRRTCRSAIRQDIRRGPTVASSRSLVNAP